MSAGMTVELTLNTDIGVLSVGNADTGEDFGSAMNNLYQDMSSSGGGTAGGIGLGGINGSRDERIDGRGVGTWTGGTPLSAAAAAATTANLGRGNGVDTQGTLWPAFAMHQPGDSVTFLPRRAEDGFSMPRTLSSGGATGTTMGGYRSLQALLGPGSGGMTGGVGGGPGGGGGGPFTGQSLPLGYPDPLLLEHATAALEMAAGVLREAGEGRDEDENDEGVGVVARCEGGAD